MPRKPENLIGQKFGRLTVIADTKIKVPNRTYTYQKCLCDCGNIISVPKAYLKSKHIFSCGCYRKEKATRHNLSNTRLYSIWSGIKRRCNNSNFSEYNLYGGRGIKICEIWENDFLSFYNWSVENGYSDKLSIDRIDNDGNYCPENCRWVDRLIQSNNTSRNVKIEYNGKKMSISEWSRETGIPQNTLSRRYKIYNNLDIVFYKGDLKKCKKMLKQM